MKSLSIPALPVAALLMLPALAFTACKNSDSDPPPVGTSFSVPASLEARGVTAHQIELQWKDNTTTESGFKIKRSPDGTKFKLIHIALKNSTVFLDTVTEAETTYYYMINAYNATEESDYSNIASAATLLEPTDLEATAPSSSQIDLLWSDHSTIEDGYAIERSTDGVEYTPLTTVAKDITAFSDDQLSPEVKHFYRVQAFSAGGSLSIFCTPSFATPLMAPSDLEAMARSSTRIDLQWMDHSAMEDGYAIERSMDGVNFDPIDTVSKDVTAFSDEDLSPETDYYYQVRAFDLDGNLSDFSDAASAATFIAPWAISYGEALDEGAFSTARTIDGGFIVAGATDSFVTDPSDAWILKLDERGAIEWEKAYGGMGEDSARCIAQTSDTGFIAAGSTSSFGAGSSDFWILKLYPDGTVEWEKAYGGGASDDAKWISQTSDGGYIVAGTSATFGPGPLSFWILKLKSDGAIEWQKSYGGDYDDLAHCIRQTIDGGYIVAGDDTYFAAGGSDAWILKLTSNGSIAWEKTYGGTGYDHATSVLQTPDTGYIVAGTTSSFGAGSSDIWILKLNPDGSIGWQKTYGNPNQDYVRSLSLTDEGGYIVAGSTESFVVTFGDFWVLKLDDSGGVEWEKAYGGDGDDLAQCICPRLEGGYFVTGSTQSFGAGYEDFWTLDLDPDGSIDFDPASGAKVQDTSATVGDTPAAPFDTAATVIVTSVVPTDTNATVTDTNCTTNKQTP